MVYMMKHDSASQYIFIPNVFRNTFGLIHKLVFLLKRPEKLFFSQFFPFAAAQSHFTKTITRACD